MRHPFDGIVAPKANRRSWLKVFAGALAGWFGYASVSRAVGPPPKVRLEPPANPEPGKPMTDALIPSETGGNPATLALNEQGGRMTKAKGEQGRVTTKALREEGAAKPLPPGKATTLALGEEGGKN
jgi:hypothetical protein